MLQDSCVVASLLPFGVKGKEVVNTAVSELNKKCVEKSLGVNAQTMSTDGGRRFPECIVT